MAKKYKSTQEEADAIYNKIGKGWVENRVAHIGSRWNDSDMTPEQMARQDILEQVEKARRRRLQQ